MAFDLCFQLYNPLLRLVTSSTLQDHQRVSWALQEPVVIEEARRRYTATNNLSLLQRE